RAASTGARITLGAFVLASAFLGARAAHAADAACPDGRGSVVRAPSSDLREAQPDGTQRLLCGYSLHYGAGEPDGSRDILVLWTPTETSVEQPPYCGAHPT